MRQQVVIEGSGGREHALAEAMIASGAEVYVDPGNAGTRGEGYLPERPDGASLYLIGPEMPLIEGRADALEHSGHGGKVLGINRETSFLEASKVDADAFMERSGVLRPPSLVVRSEEEARAAIKGRDPQSYVLKADKPAGGKGVVLPKTTEEAVETMAGMLSGELFGGSGKERFQVQDRWHGPEVSVFAVGDGTGAYYVIPFFSQDHKRLLDGDEGPNTGGMGAYSPVPDTILSNRQIYKIHESIDRTYNGLARESFSSKGILYFSFMLAEESGQIDGSEPGDPAMIEYNIRFGDPEAQVVLPTLVNAGIDAYDLFRSAAAGNLNGNTFEAREKVLNAGGAALAVCMADVLYPDSPRKNDVIFGLEKVYEGVLLHYAGAKRQGERILTAGGRVLYVTGLGQDIDEAARNAYAAIGDSGVHFDGMQYRTDIGWQARTSQS